MDTKRWSARLLFYGTVAFGFLGALAGVASRLGLFGFDISWQVAIALVATFIFLCVVLLIVERKQ